MYFIKPASLLALLALRCAALSSDTGISLVAYGDNIDGLTLCYGNHDGLAYVAKNPPSNYSPMMFNINTSSSTDLPAKFNNQSTAGSLYINPSGSTNVGFMSNTTSPPTNATTTGFRFYGTMLVYEQDNQYSSNFYAQSSDTDDLFSLSWISGGSSSADTVPVVLKKYESTTQTSTTQTSTTETATTQAATTQTVGTQTPTCSSYY